MLITQSNQNVWNGHSVHQSVTLFILEPALQSWLLRFMAATCMDLLIVLICLFKLQQRRFGPCLMDFRRLCIFLVCVCDGLDIWCVHSGRGWLPSYAHSTSGACYKVCGREKLIVR